MKIGLIGAGKVGFTLGKFFAEGGIPVTGYYSRSRVSAQEAAEFTQTRCYDQMEALIQESDAIFLTVPDGAITEVYRQVSQYEIRDKLICHCSGALSASDAFPGIEQTGACGYSIHPLFPISSKYHAYRELSDAFFCLEGNETHLPQLQTLLEGLGCRVQIIPAEAKVRYHAGCAIASNLVCGLIQESIDLLTTCGFSSELALAALSPLMRSNMNHLAQVGPTAALTGPVERGDTATVQKHLACFDSQDERELYRLLSKKLVDVAQQKNPDRDYQPLRHVLKEN
jgi:predicted short-subunit dehydrogenase-like oxidoreductase (DUF2520 family)